MKRNRIQILFYLMVAFALLGPTFGIPITQKFTLTFFRIFFVILAISFLIDRFRNRRWKKNPDRTSLHWVALFFLFWFMYGLVSLTWAVSISDGVRYLVFLGMMLLLTLSFPTFVKTEEQYWTLQRILLGVFAFIVCMGVFESITLLHLPSSRAFGTTSASVTSVFTNQNDLGTCITLAFPFLLTALIMLKIKRKYKWVVYLTAVLAIYVLLSTGSRSNTVFALPFSIMVLALTLPFAVPTSTWSKKFWLKAIAALLAGGLIVNTMNGLFLSEEARQAARNKLAGTFGFFQDIGESTWELDVGSSEIIRGKTGESATVRKFLIINGLKFLRQSHYLGVGAGNIEPLMKGAPKVNKVNMHNWWVEILVNFGVIVFILYMTFYSWMLWRLWKLARKSKTLHLPPLLRWGAVSSLASLIGYIFGAIAPSTAIHFTPMWTSIGIGLIVIQLGEVQQRKNKWVSEDRKSIA